MPRVPLILHVNRARIAHNQRTGMRLPPIAVRRGRRGKAEYVMAFEHPSFRVVYRPDQPLPCGARLWVEVLDEQGWWVAPAPEE
jgi:hypothetical protein